MSLLDSSISTEERKREQNGARGKEKRQKDSAG